MPIPFISVPRLNTLPALAVLFLAGCLLSPPALALSEMQDEQAPSAAPIAPAPAGPAESAPDEGDPAAQEEPAAEAPVIPEDPGEETAQPEGAADLNPGRFIVDPNAPLPEIIYDLERLPAPVRRMRELIMEACASGDPEKLRQLIGTTDPTQLTLGGEAPADPIAYLREHSGDGEGHEILAILLEVLQAGYVHLDAGTPNELYVWPYFFAMPLDRLDPRQRVELFKIVTAGDYEDMKSFGAYIFYRAGITPEGRWAFFVAGD